MCVNSFSSGQLYEVYAVGTLILQMKFRNIKKSKFIAVIGRRDCNRFFGFGAVILNITIEAIDSQSVVPGPAASALPGNLLEMQILYPTPGLLDQNLWARSPALLQKPSRGFVNRLKSENHCSRPAFSKLQ